MKYVLVSRRVRGYRELSNDDTGVGKPVLVAPGALATIIKRGRGGRLLVSLDYAGRHWFAWVNKDQMEKAQANPRRAVRKPSATRKNRAALLSNPPSRSGWIVLAHARSGRVSGVLKNGALGAKSAELHDARPKAELLRAHAEKTWRGHGLTFKVIKHGA